MAEASVTEQAQALTLQGSCSSENGEHMNGLNTGENNMADREIVQGLSKETRNGDLYKYSEDGEDFDPTYNNQSGSLISPSTDQKVPIAFSDEDSSHFHGDASQQFFESPQSAPDQEIPFGSDAAAFPPQHSEEALGSHIEDSFSPFTSEMSSYSHAGSQDSFTPFGGEKDNIDQEQDMIQPSGLISPQPISQENVLIDFGKESEESESTEGSPAGDRRNPFLDDHNSNFASENMFSQPIVESKSGNDIPDPNGNAAGGVDGFTALGQEMPDVSSNPVSEQSVLQPDLISMGESGLSTDSFVNKQEAHNVIDDFAQSNENVPVMQSGVSDPTPPPPQSFQGTMEEAAQEQYSDGDEDYSESESNSQLENDEIIEDDYTESDDNLDEMNDSEGVSTAMAQNSVKPDMICDNLPSAPAAVEHMEVEDNLKSDGMGVDNKQLPVDQMDHGASEQIPKDQLSGGAESDSDLEEGSVSPDEAQYDNLDKQQLSPHGVSEASGFDNDKADMVDQFEVQNQNIADINEQEDHGFQEKDSLSDSEVMEPERSPTMEHPFSQEQFPSASEMSQSIECEQLPEKPDRGSSAEREEEMQRDMEAEYEENDQKTPTECEPMSQEPGVAMETKTDLSQWDEVKAEERYKGRSQSPEEGEFSNTQFQQKSFEQEPQIQQEQEAELQRQQAEFLNQQEQESAILGQQQQESSILGQKSELPSQQEQETESSRPQEHQSALLGQQGQQEEENESPRQQEQECELPSEQEQDTESSMQQGQEAVHEQPNEQFYEQDQNQETKPGMLQEQERFSTQQDQHFFDTRQEEEEEYESDDNNEEIVNEQDFPVEHEASSISEKPQGVPEDSSQGQTSNIDGEPDEQNFSSEPGQLGQQTELMSSFKDEFQDQISHESRDELVAQSDSHEASPAFEDEGMDEEDVMVEPNIQEEDQFGTQVSAQTQEMPSAAMMGSFVGTEEDLGLADEEEFEDQQYTDESPQESQQMDEQASGKLEIEFINDPIKNLEAQNQDFANSMAADEDVCEEMEDRGGVDKGSTSQSEEREKAIEEQKRIDAEGDSGPSEHALEEYSKDRMEEEDELPSHEDKEEVGFNEEMKESSQQEVVIDNASSAKDIETINRVEEDVHIPFHEEKEEETRLTEDVALPPQNGLMDNLPASSIEATGFEKHFEEKELLPHEEKEDVAIENEVEETPQQQHVIETPPSPDIKEELKGGFVDEDNKEISKVVDNKQEDVSSSSFGTQSGEIGKPEKITQSPAGDKQDVISTVPSGDKQEVTSTVKPSVITKQESTPLSKEKEKAIGKVTKKEVKPKLEKPKLEKPKPKPKQTQPKKPKEGTPPKEPSKIPSPTKSGGKLPGQKPSRAVKASTPPQWDSTTVTPPLPRVMSTTRMPRSVAKKQEEAAQRPTSIQQNSTDEIQTPPRPRPDKSPSKRESTSAFLARMSRPVQRGSTPKKDGSSDSGVEEDRTARQKSATRKKFGIDSHNTSYKPGGGNVKILNQKVTPKNVTSRIDARSATPTRSPTKPKPASTPSPKLPDTKHVQSKIGSLDNARHTPGGGRVKIQTQKVDYSNVQSKTGSKDNIKHKAGGGASKIESKKLNWNVDSRIGSLDNAKHSPGGGNVKIKDEKVQWKKESKIGSLDNVRHSPGGGQVKILDEKVQWKTQSKIGSMDNAKHSPGGGNVKIESHKLDIKAESKIGSKDNLDHKAGGGDKKIPIQKLDFKEKASSKVGSKDFLDHKPGGGDKKIESQKLNFRETAKPRTNTGGAAAPGQSRPDSGISQDMAKPE